nr:uncharacterized protein LOC110125045 isoform X2 [Odocoileus virginianus texanus]
MNQSMRKEDPQTSVGPKAATLKLKNSLGLEEVVFFKKCRLFSRGLSISNGSEIQPVLQIGVITQSQGTPFSDKHQACSSTCWAMRSPHQRDTPMPRVCVLTADSTQGVKNPVSYSPQWCSCCPRLPKPSLHKTSFSLRASSGPRAHPAQSRLDNQSPFLAVLPPAHLLLPLSPPLS